MAESNLLIVCVPSLVATLLNRERAKGSPLTEQEVLDIRDKAPAIAMPDYALAEVEAQRGYKDIAPENAWEDGKRLDSIILISNKDAFPMPRTESLPLLLADGALSRVARTTCCPGARSAQEAAQNVRPHPVASCASTEVSVEAPGQQVVRATLLACATI